MANPQVHMEGIAFGEQPRWHEDRPEQRRGALGDAGLASAF